MALQRGFLCFQGKIKHLVAYKTRKVGYALGGIQSGISPASAWVSERTCKRVFRIIKFSGRNHNTDLVIHEHAEEKYKSLIYCVIEYIYWSVDIPWVEFKEVNVIDSIDVE